MGRFWGAPAQAAAPGRFASSHSGSPVGRLEPRVGPRSMVGPDRHHGRNDLNNDRGLSVLAAMDGLLAPSTRGRSERMFGTLQKRRELRLAGITDMAGANRFLKEVFLPQHNARFATPAEAGHRLRPLHRRAQRHPVHPRGTHCLKRGASAWHFRSPPAATAAITSRPESASTNTPTAQWPSSMDRDVWRDTTPMANLSPNPRGRVTRFDATDRRPVDKWTAAPRPTTSPQGQQPQQKRSTHMVHKPAECSRHGRDANRADNPPFQTARLEAGRACHIFLIVATPDFEITGMGRFSGRFAARVTI